MPRPFLALPHPTSSTCGRSEHVLLTAQAPFQVLGLLGPKADKAASHGAGILGGTVGEREGTGWLARASCSVEPGPHWRLGEGLLTWAPDHHHGELAAQVAELPTLG